MLLIFFAWHEVIGQRGIWQDGVGRRDALERGKQTEKALCLVFCKSLILSAPVGFDPPQRLFTLPDAIFCAHNAISPSTTENFNLTMEITPSITRFYMPTTGFERPLSDFLCPQQDLSGPERFLVSTAGFELHLSNFFTAITGINPPQPDFLYSQYETSGLQKIFSKFLVAGCRIGGCELPK